MANAPRDLSGVELSALSAYLPEDLTADQLEDVLRAAAAVATEAYAAGHTAGRTITSMRLRAEAQDRRREEASTQDQDSRVKAWEAVAEHPFFRDSYSGEGTLLESVLAKLTAAHDRDQRPTSGTGPTELHITAPAPRPPWGDR